MAALLTVVFGPESEVTLTVVWAPTWPVRFWLFCTSSEPVATEPTSELPVEVVTWVVSPEEVTTLRVPEAKISPDWSWSLTT